MEETIDDLILPSVNKILEEVLGGYPEYPYRKALTNPDLRRKVIAQVLSQLSNWHPSKEGNKIVATDSEDLQLSIDEKIHIQNLIRQEIAYIVQPKADCISRTPTEDVDSRFTPSHWFG